MVGDARKGLVISEPLTGTTAHMKKGNNMSEGIAHDETIKWDDPHAGMQREIAPLAVVINGNILIAVVDGSLIAQTYPNVDEDGALEVYNFGGHATEFLEANLPGAQPATFDPTKGQFILA